MVSLRGHYALQTVLGKEMKRHLRRDRKTIDTYRRCRSDAVWQMSSGYLKVSVTDGQVV